VRPIGQAAASIERTSTQHHPHPPGHRTGSTRRRWTKTREAGSRMAMSVPKEADRGDQPRPSPAEPPEADAGPLNHPRTTALLTIFVAQVPSVRNREPQKPPRRESDCSLAKIVFARPTAGNIAPPAVRQQRRVRARRRSGDSYRHRARVHQQTPPGRNNRGKTVRAEGSPPCPPVEERSMSSCISRGERQASRPRTC